MFTPDYEIKVYVYSRSRDKEMFILKDYEIKECVYWRFMRLKKCLLQIMRFLKCYSRIMRLKNEFTAGL